MTLSFNASFSRSNGPDGATLGLLVCLTICLSPLAIVSIYYASTESDADCQEGTRAGLNLSEWLMGSGTEKLAVLASFWVIALSSMCIGGDASLGIGAFVIVADVLFSIVWWIIGVVVLATNENNKCVAEGNPMAIVAIVNLVLTWFSFASVKSQG